MVSFIKIKHIWTKTDGQKIGHGQTEWGQSTFDELGFTVVRDFADVSHYYKQMLSFFAQNEFYDNQCPRSKAVYNHPLMHQLLLQSKNKMEEVTKLKLYATYAYSREYVQDEILEPHTDRAACEISCTLCLGYEGKCWPIWIRGYDNKDYSVNLEAGDALVYHGCDMTHWREKNTYSKKHVQVFLHYVDQDGMYADRKDDKI